MLLLLGPPRIERGGVPVEVDRRKAIALLAYLAVTRERHSRDALATLLWPESDQSRARANLRRVLAALKKALGGNGLQVDRESVGLDWDAGLWLDVDEFHSRLAACRTHHHPEAEACSACLAPLTQAVELYRDDFLVGFTLRDSPNFDDWQFFQTENLRRELASALERLVHFHSAQGEFEPAIAYARRWLALDPLHEPAHYHLMQLYAWARQWPAALRQYRECVRVLEEELGVPPLEKTTQLYEAIKAKRTAPPPADSHSEPSSLDGALDGRSKRTPPLREASPTTRPTDGDLITPWRSLSEHPHNLPSQSTPFFGRREELARIAQLLLDDPACRLLTLVGPGGIGKTRLALQAAADAIEAFPHGVYFVPLAPVNSANFLISAIAEALNFSFYGSEDPKVQLLNYLRKKEMLLVMDNFEHLVAGTRFLTNILQNAPEVTLLVTSRERLNLHGEWILEIGGLEYPEDARLEGVERYSAVQLFLQSALRVRSDFALSEAQKRFVVRICQLVGGMPLGIELAAAWARVLSCEEIAREIEDNLGFLATSLRDVPERHRSLRAVFQHSWNLLLEEERQAFRKLSVFRGGFRREAAEQVAGASLPLLLALVDKSLLRSNPSGRFEMLEILRQYAEDKLSEVPEDREEARDLHCSYYAQFLQQRQEHVRGGRQRDALAEIGEEIQNVRAGWRWALDRGKHEEIAKSLECLYHFYEIRGWFQEGEQAFALAADRLRATQCMAEEAEAEESEILGKLLARRGGFSFRLGLHEKAKELLQESLSILHDLGARGEMAFSLNHLGDVARTRGQYTEAKQFLQESIAICKQTGDRRRKARALNNLGIVAGSLGDLSEAEQLFQHALEIFKELRDQWGITKALNNLGIIAYWLGEYAKAKQLLEESVAICKQTHDRYGLGTSTSNLGRVAHYLAEYAEAKQLLQESIAIFKEIGYQPGIGVCLKDLGNVACARGEYQAAEHYFHEALKVAMESRAVPAVLAALVGLATLLSETGEEERALELLSVILHHPAIDKDTKDSAERLLSKLKSQLPAQVIATAHERGKTTELESEVINDFLPPSSSAQFK
ncbi:MAG: tetratricopeptide repeat protein [Anaerolineae bacterium]